MRARGEGSVFKHKNGMWCACLTVGLKGNGRRNRIYAYSSTQSGALKELRNMQADADTGRPVDLQRCTLAEYLGKWLETAARPTIRAGTHRNYKHWIEKKITPTIGGVILSKLGPLHVQSLYTNLEAAGASPRLREQVHNLLHKALGQALKWGMVRQNACASVHKPRVPKTTMRVLSKSQVESLLEVSKNDRFAALYVTAVTTGLRQGELLGLQWEDVDLRSGHASIRHTLQNDRGKLTLESTKNSKGRRVELPQITVNALKAQREWLMAQGLRSSPWVFPNSKGGPMRKDNLLRLFKALLKRAALPPVRFHDLRHTAATLMLVQGVHPKVVQEMLGHSSISLTLDTYSHVIPTMQRDAANKMDALFSLPGSRQGL